MTVGLDALVGIFGVVAYLAGIVTARRFNRVDRIVRAMRITARRSGGGS